MQFLDGAAATAEIKRLVMSSKTVRMAVAFWGKGASEELGLMSKKNDVTVICNLNSGGTNPNEIEYLLGNKISVRQCSTLHGKVYLFDNCVIVGSSNASANGLALQGKEISGWSEANILTNDPVLWQAASQWFSALITDEITSDDLKNAELAFSKRRASALPQVTASGSLAKALRARPEIFESKRIFVGVYGSLLTTADMRRVKIEQNKHRSDRSIDAVRWHVPTGANLILFYVNKNSVEFHGFWERNENEWKSDSLPPLYFMHKISKIYGFSSTGILSSWRNAVAEFYKNEVRGSKLDAKHIEFGSFYQKYISKTKILNVMDDHKRLRAIESGFFESGFWRRPELDCDIIRVFTDNEEKSCRGGRIVKIREEIRGGEKIKIFTFEDDPSQHGKPRPKFRQNGCVATFE
ncbi:phospholipase D family protein [Methylosinus sporium]|nr:phospholipase D family protein [Methylosinus sporium]